MSPPAPSGGRKGRQAGKKKGGVGRDRGRVRVVSPTTSLSASAPPFFDLPSVTAITVTRRWTTGMSHGEEGLSTAGRGWGLGSNSPGGF